MKLHKLSLAFAGLLLSFPPAAGSRERLPAPSDTLPARSLRAAVVSARMAPAAVRAAAPLFELGEAFAARSGLDAPADWARHLPAATVRDYGGPSGLKTVSVRALGAAHTSVVVDGLPVSDLLSGAVDLGRLPAGRVAAMSLALGAGDDLLVPPSARTAATLSVSTTLPAVRPGPSRSSAMQTQSKEKLTQTNFKLTQRKFELTQTKFTDCRTDASPAAVNASPTRLSGAASLDAGQWGATGAALSLAGRTGSCWQTGAGVQWRRSAGDFPFTLTNHQLQSRERRAHSLFQQLSMQVRALGRAASGAETDVKGSFVHDYRQLPGPVVYYTARGTENIRDDRAEISARRTQRRGRWRTVAALRSAWSGYRYRDRDAQQPGGLLERMYGTAELYALGGAALRFGRAKTAGRPFLAALAADYTFQHLDASTPDADGAARHSLHAEAALRYAAPRLQLTGSLGAVAIGGRGPHSGNRARPVRDLRPEVSARCVLWRAAAGETALRFYWRRSLRVPSFSDCYFYRLGSTDLRPERVRQAGAGLVSDVCAARGALRLQLTADFYAQSLADRLSALPLSPYLWRMANRGRSEGLGADVSLHAAARLAARHAVEAAASLSCSGLRDRSDRNDAAYGLRPAYVPALWGSASALWRNPWADVRFWLTVQGERWSTDEHAAGTSLAPAAELGAGLARSLRLGRATGEIALECLNLTDTQYEIIRRYPMPGRTWRASWRVSF
ncbi:MAG: TonB-dependent receptor [Prevotellaceae bacterium]|nr:TonB-dependent receptor [Prevotellaceae bacterium]